VKDVARSSQWYQALLGCKSIHGGNEFDVLVNEHKEVILCLHKWGEHEHPTMTASSESDGNGLIFYFRTSDIEKIRKRLMEINYPVEREIQLNPNSKKKEFSVKDLDGYFLTISEDHDF